MPANCSLLSHVGNVQTNDAVVLGGMETPWKGLGRHMEPLRFALVGAGFWARFQLAAWMEVPGAKCVAVCDRIPEKAEALAREFGIPWVHSDPQALCAAHKLDFVDIVTDAESHEALAAMAARRGLAAICQKPLAPDLAAAARMVNLAKSHHAPLLVHENWRWQAPIRALKEVLAGGELGQIIRSRIDYANSFPVFDNQPFLKNLKQFILMDMGTHIFDVARFLWGEAEEVYCQTRRIHPGIQGEDVATTLLRMRDGVTVTANLSYASKWEYDRFPETVIQVEGSEGGASLGLGQTLRVFTKEGTRTAEVRTKSYAWADPAYALVHASIVECHRNLLAALQGKEKAETTAEDNLKTLRLVFAAYDSATGRKAVRL